MQISEKQQFKTLREKHMILWQLAYRMDEIRIMAARTSDTQAELLSQEKKKTLLKYDQYVGIKTKSGWKKLKAAEEFCKYMQEHIWLMLLMLPRDAVELYTRLCRLKPEQRLSVDKGSEAPLLLVDLGLVDLTYLPAKELLVLELAEDIKECFLEMLRDVH